MMIGKATYEEPEQASAGIDWVVVNGQIDWRQGQMGACSGRLLLRLE
jgi:hypothetical protein